MRVAFPTNNQRTIAKHIGLAKGFLIIDTNTGERFYIENPVLKKVNEENINLKELPEGQRGLGTGRIVPVILKEAGADVFVAQDFGEGMVKNLAYEGIKPLITDIKDIDEALKHLDELKAAEPIEDYEFEGFGYGRRFGRGFGRGYGFAHGFVRGFGRKRGRGFGRGFGYAKGFRGRWD